MKFAEYVDFGQMALSTILVVVFMTRSGAATRGSAAALKARTPHGEHATGEDEGAEPRSKHEGKGEKSEKAEKSGKGEKADKGDKGKPDKVERVDFTQEAEGSPDEAWGGGEGADHAKGRKAGKLAQADDAKPSDSRKGKGDKAGKEKPDKDKADKDGDALATDPKEIAQDLLAGNARFIEGQRSNISLVEQREASAGAQHPGVMVLGCADSRVPPELVFDRGVGEMFVVRSAGNIAEPVAVGSLEYAAEHLHAKVLLVLGHEKCGAVQAALSDAKIGSPNLEALIANITPAVKELKAWAEGDQLWHMAVEANVRRQAEEILRRSPMLRQAVTKKEVTLLKAIYDPQTGHVHPL